MAVESPSPSPPKPSPPPPSPPPAEIDTVTVTSVVAVDAAYLPGKSPAFVKDAFGRSNNNKDALEVTVQVDLSSAVQVVLPPGTTQEALRDALQLNICEGVMPPECVIEVAQPRVIEEADIDFRQRRRLSEDPKDGFIDESVLGKNGNASYAAKRKIWYCENCVSEAPELECTRDWMNDPVDARCPVPDLTPPNIRASAIEQAMQEAIAFSQEQPAAEGMVSTTFAVGPNSAALVAAAIASQKNMMGPLSAALGVPLEALSFVQMPTVSWAMPPSPPPGSLGDGSDASPPSPATPSPVPPSTTGGGGGPTMIIMMGAAAGGGCLLLTCLTILIVCCCKRKRTVKILPHGDPRFDSSGLPVDPRRPTSESQKHKPRNTPSKGSNKVDPRDDRRAEQAKHRPRAKHEDDLEVEDFDTDEESEETMSIGSSSRPSTANSRPPTADWRL